MLLHSLWQAHNSCAAGRTRIKLRKTGEVYSLVPPNSKAHNVIVGGTWVDCYGDFKLSNVTTGTQCSLFFTPCGWFGSGRYEVGFLPLLQTQKALLVHLHICRQAILKAACLLWNGSRKMLLILINDIMCILVGVKTGF